MCSVSVWGRQASELLISRIPSSSVQGWTELLCFKLDPVSQNRELAKCRLQHQAAKIQSEREEKGREPIHCPATLCNLGPAPPDWVCRSSLLWVTPCIRLYTELSMTLWNQMTDAKQMATRGNSALDKLKIATKLNIKRATVYCHPCNY